MAVRGTNRHYIYRIVTVDAHLRLMLDPDEDSFIAAAHS